MNETADAARVIEWANSKPRKPANLAFTSGPERQAAYWIEWAEARMTAPAPQPEQKVCEWDWANGAWVSGCKAWAMLVSPLKNGQRVCRYCGLPIREVGGEAR